MKGVKHSSYLWVADNNWINFAEKWMCFDALVADWQSAGFLPYLSFPFYLLLPDLSTASIPGPANQTTF